MKDHTVPVSNQTTLSGARPLWCPPTHTTMAARRASSTRQHRRSGSSWWGDPAVDEDPGGHPALPLVVVLLMWWLAIRMLTSYVRREALPLMAVAPHPASRCALVYTVSTPTSATHATAPSNNPWYLKHLLLCVYLYGRLFRVHRQWAIFATCVETVSSLHGTEANINDSPLQRAHTHAHVGT